ncbi:hypothetical protein COX84_02430 [Candidatus Micrarchaeota archaeon CG_4_10_14_0_2_um_filter_49_7]|nr:MAG: hypothetical protein COX84_02430 [Candidatus Micrarchaeota archaeon CG_4_10_14_0_2_um_filter_49_7]
MGRRSQERYRQAGQVDVTATDNNGRTVLHHAVRSGCISVVEELLRTITGR